ncbi:MAG: hypothetical protein M3Q38_00230, partial [Chloroflexota bacterium]|nr:hypothetical protein [Chloroflexota bacterium]
MAAQTPAGSRPATSERTGRPVARLGVGLDANPKTTAQYRDDAWNESIELMQTTGATQFHYSQQWSAFETQADVFKTTELESRVRQSRRTPIAFTLKIIDAGRRTMPEAYKSLAWDSPEMIARLGRVIARLAPLLGNRLSSYAIGNEIDMYFDSRPQEVAAYARLLLRMKALIRQLHPAASFTTVLQFGAVPQVRGRYAPIVDTLDHVAFTYYPLTADLRVRPPESILADLPLMLAAAQPRPIALQELGYPTAAVLGSSQEQQSTFVRLVFDAVRIAGTERVVAMTYLFQADFPEWLVNDLAQVYGAEGENFRAFLRTLGLRDERDRPKLGWNEFVRQLED